MAQIESVRGLAGSMGLSDQGKPIGDDELEQHLDESATHDRQCRKLSNSARVVVVCLGGCGSIRVVGPA